MTAEPPLSSDAVELYDDAELAWRRRGPTPRAVRAFGVRDASLRRLAGGAGYNWTDGRLVLKPVGYVPEHDWICEVYAGWTSTEVRVPEPVEPDGDSAAGWSVDGWGAHVFLAGRDLDLDRELPLVKEASDAFHACVAELPRPDFLDTRNDPWAFGDRLAWESAEPPTDPETLQLIDRLLPALCPVTTPDQAIHGDILPNVLAGDGWGPASSTGRCTSGPPPWPPRSRRPTR
jgi:hypothetical protein